MLLVTHDLDTLLGIARRVVVLGQGKVIADGTIEQVMAVDDPWIRAYFEGRRMISTPSGRDGIDGT